MVIREGLGGLYLKGSQKAQVSLIQETLNTNTDAEATSLRRNIRIHTRKPAILVLEALIGIILPANTVLDCKTLPATVCIRFGTPLQSI